MPSEGEVTVKARCILDLDRHRACYAGIVESILHDDLHSRKLFARWKAQSSSGSNRLHDVIMGDVPLLAFYGAWFYDAP